MAISADERRFLRYWEEQSKGGKWSYIPMYALCYFIMLYLGGVALGLFLSLPFVKPAWLIALGIFSLVGGISIALFQWRMQHSKFRKIIHRELGDKE